MVRLVGVDVFLKSETIPEVPREQGNLKLTFIANRGTRIWPGKVPDMHLLELMRCRYESEQGVTDEEIDNLLHALTSGGFHWASSQKLFAENGEELYSQPY